MKTFFSVVFVVINAIVETAQTYQSTSATPDSSKQILLVDASCGQCQFGMKGSGCSLAVLIDGKSYFVEGTDIDAYGDAHAHDGFCEAIRKAEVQGEIKGDKFITSYFKLIDFK